MTWTVLIAHVSAFDPALLNVAFVFLFLGYGTKVGLAPLHAWLPDAHAEGPTPISAVLSGLLLNVALYAILRFKMLMTLNVAAIAPGPLMVTVGLISVLFAAFMLYRRRDIKRLFAYSSIEHMGIIVFAFGMGGPLANFAGLLQMTMHSLTKSAIFFTVGHIAQVKGTQRIAEIRGLTESHPVLGWSLVLGVIAIAGLPPLGIFMSEFLIVSSTFARAPLLALALVSRPAGRVRCAFAAPSGLAFGEPTGSRGAGARLLCADLRASGAGAGGGPLSATHARDLVPARRADVGIDDARMHDLGRDHRRRAESGDPPAMAAHRDRCAGLAERWRTACGIPVHIVGTVGRCGNGPYGGPAGGRRQSGCSEPALSGRPFPVRRATSSAGDPPGARDTRSVRPEAAERSRTCAPGSITDVGARATPLARKRREAKRPYEFLPAEGEGLHQIAVGPVHAGIIEPGHFRFHANGETIVRLEARLGYAHKGIESLMQGSRSLHAPRSSPAASPATARWPMRSRSPAPSKRPLEWKFRRAPIGCAR